MKIQLELEDRMAQKLGAMLQHRAEFLFDPDPVVDEEQETEAQAIQVLSEEYYKVCKAFDALAHALQNDGQCVEAEPFLKVERVA